MPTATAAITTVSLCMAAGVCLGQPAVVTSRLGVQAAPEADAGEIGLLTPGDVVQVRGCDPSCDAPGAWAELEGGGFVRASSLGPAGEAGPPPDVPLPFLYAKVVGDGARTREHPDPEARVIAVDPPGHVLAFLAADPSAEWLVRRDGGFVRAQEVRPYPPTTLVGVHRPSLPLAFVVRPTEAVSAGGEHLPLSRYDRHRVDAVDGDRVTLDVGRVPRSKVRIAQLRPRPEGVPPGARWVHVDLSQQVLVAYEGDTPVFATLVSTGKTGLSTPEGTFESWNHVRDGLMHGSVADEGYYIEAVPWTLYFRRGYALHGAFWHDQFGARRTHGCVNLAPADALWLFRWAPPALPPGWHAIRADVADRGRLWVVIDRWSSESPPVQEAPDLARPGADRPANSVTGSSGARQGTRPPG